MPTISHRSNSALNTQALFKQEALDDRADALTPRS
jgi:hypothetical protein